MKTLAIVLTCMATAFAARGASVLWDVIVFQQSNSDHDGIPISWFGAQFPGGLPVRPCVAIAVTQTTRPFQTTVSGADYAVDLERLDSWVVMSEGDLVDESSTRHLDSAFLHSGLDWEEFHADQTVVGGRGPFSFYLGFATGEERWDDFGNLLSDHVYYGWALFEWTGREIVVLESALNAETNGGIYVGTGITTPVPEPSGAALALAGAALLVRRRMEDPAGSRRARKGPRKGPPPAKCPPCTMRGGRA